MKKTSSFMLAMLLFALLLGGCSQGAATGQQGSSKDYGELIASVRTEDENKAFPLVSSTEDKDYDLVFEVFGASESSMQRYAISVGLIIIHAYGVAIILPQQGKEQLVREEMDAYVEEQKKAFENYLPKQYEIASNALVETAESGEMLLVMCEDAPAVMQTLKDGLKA